MYQYFKVMVAFMDNPVAESVLREQREQWDWVRLWLRREMEPPAHLPAQPIRSNLSNDSAQSRRLLRTVSMRKTLDSAERFVRFVDEAAQA